MKKPIHVKTVLVRIMPLALAACLPIGTLVVTAAETASDAYRLSYQIPDGWASDHDLARKRELTALLVPGGKTYRDAEAMITIAFERKYRGLPMPQTLKQYFFSEMSKLLRIFPEMQSIEWRPASLDEFEVEAASIEIFVASRGPMRLVMIDVGDGYYSISLGVEDYELFERADIKGFFDSLELLPL